MRLNREIKQRPIEIDEEIERVVRTILNDVRENGDSAVKKYSDKFDLPFEAGDPIDDNFLRILKRTKSQIEEFHKKQISSGFEIQKPNGVIMGQMVRPLARVAVYVPGGTACYPSSVLMNIIPAQLAGVKEIAIFTPQPNNIIKAAANVCGVNTIYQIGGAQAIAAAAYGTETIPKFDKIVGPGNSYVAMAKKLVYGEVDIDMIAGPSEVLIIADETANPEYIAADLMSQAEHDIFASSILITTSERIIRQTEEAIEKQLQYLSRAEIIKQSLDNYGSAILVDTLEKAFEMSNDIAPEHLEILTENPYDKLDLIQNAGSIFLGEFTPEPLGDYMSGTNHVLPTGGTAKFYSPLGVYDFVKYSSYSYYTEQALKEFKDDVITFAKAEGFDAHANSMEVRFK